MNKKGITLFEIVGIILFLFLFLIVVVLSVSHIRWIYQAESFCESQGGEIGNSYSTCIIKENSTYVSYQVEKYKGKWVLVK